MIYAAAVALYVSCGLAAMYYVDGTRFASGTSRRGSLLWAFWMWPILFLLELAFAPARFYEWISDGAGSAHRKQTERLREEKGNLHDKIDRLEARLRSVTRTHDDAGQYLGLPDGRPFMDRMMDEDYVEKHTPPPSSAGDLDKRTKEEVEKREEKWRRERAEGNVDITIRPPTK